MRMIRVILVILLASGWLQAQEVIKGKSQAKPVKYGQATSPVGIRLLPDLIILNEKFNDNNGNNIIDANEPFQIVFKVQNIGKGEAKNVKAVVQQKNTELQGLTFSPLISLGTIGPDQVKEVTISGSASMGLPSGMAEFRIEINEERGLDAFPLEMRIETAAFREPELVLADAVFSTEDGGVIKLNYPIILRILIQNIGYGHITDARSEFTFPNPNCLVLGDTNVFFIGNVPSGQTKQLDFVFTASRRYTLPQIPVRVRITESLGKYTLDTLLQVNLNQNLLASNQVVIQGTRTSDAEIKKASLFAEVDRNIPVNPYKNPMRFALVIGNEDYRRFQRGVSEEINVPYAKNDAAIFREYLINALGFEESNVYLLQDATTGEMLQKIDLVSKLCLKAGPESELLFYYAGHGLPDESTRIPYLIPVDVSGTNLSAAIKLGDIYEKFSQSGASRITVILDACFSGGGRETGLIAARGVKIRPKDDYITGNIVVFSASSGEQSAMPYKDKQHGIFTYHLLKKLQDTQGQISYRELGSYLQQTVAIESLKINQKEQDPQVITSPEIIERWENWRWVEE